MITPVNTAHRTVVMAIERGKLQDLIFDNRALASHRAMAAILGVILKLPPLKQFMANQQMSIKSANIEAPVNPITVLCSSKGGLCLICRLDLHKLNRM